jgi:hypothetical protein
VKKNDEHEFLFGF